MKLNNLRLWQITLILALLPLARFGILFSSTGLTGTVIIVTNNGVPIEGAILQITALEVTGFKVGWPAIDYPSDASGRVDMGMTTLGTYYFTVAAAGYISIEDTITIDGVENEKTVEMHPIYTPDPYTDPSNPSPEPDLGYTLSWLDGVSLFFGLCTVGLYLKKPDATIDEITSLLA